MLSKFLCLPKIRSSPRVEVIPPNEPQRSVGLRTNKGRIPADLQFAQVFAAAVVKGAKNPEASKHLIEFLASEKATPTVEKWGMKRPGLPRSVDRPLPDGRGRAWHITKTRGGQQEYRGGTSHLCMSTAPQQDLRYVPFVMSTETQHLPTGPPVSRRAFVRSGLVATLATVVSPLAHSATWKVAHP
jgi:hypothetical protein